MKYIIPLILLSILLIPVAQSSYAQQQLQQQNELQGILNQIMPKIQNFTQTLKSKVQDMKNNASTELNQSSSTAKQSFFNQIMPKIQNFTQTLKSKVQDMKNNASTEL